MTRYAEPVKLVKLARICDRLGKRKAAAFVRAGLADAIRLTIAELGLGDIAHLRACAKAQQRQGDDHALDAR
jgi:hypothetical protein